MAGTLGLIYIEKAGHLSAVLARAHDRPPNWAVIILAAAAGGGRADSRAYLSLSLSTLHSSSSLVLSESAREREVIHASRLHAVLATQDILETF